jgi:hypothetical protein
VRARRDLAPLVVDGGRARIGDRRCEAALLRRLEDVDRAGHIHLRAQHRVGLAEGNLQCGEVDDVRHLVLGQGARERLRVGDVSTDERDRRELLRGRDQPKPPVVGADVERDDDGALTGQGGYRPGTEAAECPGDQPGLRHPRRS